MSQELNVLDLEKKAAELDAREAVIKSRECELNEETQHAAYDIEFKSQTYGAIYNTVLEKDRSLLSLCIAGLGFVVFIVQKPPVNSGIAILAVITVVAYLISIFSVLYIFSENSKYLVQIIHNTKQIDEYQSKLKKLDLVVAVSFYLAIVLSVIIGIGSSEILHFGTTNTTVQTSPTNTITSPVISPATTAP